MELSRRDAIAALTAAGAGSVAGCAGVEAPAEEDSGGSTGVDADAEGGEDAERALTTLVAAGEVLYPAEVDGVEEFVRTYVAGRGEARESYWAGVVAAATALDDLARDWEGAAFADLDPLTRERLFESLALSSADPDGDGDLSSRLRHYVVNELLFALYASPTGGELVGIENPVGYPGGTESYRQPPPEEFARDGGGDESGEGDDSGDAGGDGSGEGDDSGDAGGEDGG